MTMPDRGAQSLTVQLFGSFAAYVDNAPLPAMHSRKDYLLFALLIMKQGRQVLRTELAQTLWPFPDHAADRASEYLRKSLWELRKALGMQAHRLRSPTPRTVYMDLSGAQVDLIEFDEAIAKGDPMSLEAAVALYRGPLLVDGTESWIEEERERRQLAYQKALQELSALAVERGNYEQSISYLRRAKAVNPFWEPVRRAMMEMQARIGHHSEAVQEYKELHDLLWRERHAAPSSETTTLYERLRDEVRQTAQPRRSVEQTVRAAASTRHLPHPLTTFVGRDGAVREIQDRLQQTRLVTLMGTGGVGKTRLALQVASEVADRYADGAWFVELAALTDPQRVTTAIASTLGIREEPGRTIGQTLTAFLAQKSQLLVLDNCEHVVQAVARQAALLLSACPGLYILATSQILLGVSGERTWRVPSLPAPDPQRLQPGSSDLVRVIGDYAAVQLFVERAGAQRAFELTEQNARAVAQICHRLDGIPLAIELAAARVKMLSPEQIAQRLDHRFRLLTGGSQTVLPRHQTLRALIDWSYELLSARERLLMARLSVFQGGWTLEAAESACGEEAGTPPHRAAGDSRQGTAAERGAPAGKTVSAADPATAPVIEHREMSLSEHDELRDDAEAPRDADLPMARYLAAGEILDLLADLIARSLVHVVEGSGDEPRYGMQETIREYYRDRLHESGHASAMRDRHRDWFLAFAERAEPALRGQAQVNWLKALDADGENLRTALEWSWQQPHGEPSGCRMASALGMFWVTRGRFLEGREQLETALSRHDMPAATRVRALVALALLTDYQGDGGRAESCAAEGVARAQETQNDWLIGYSRLILACVLRRRDPRRAAELLEEALAIARETRSAWLIANALSTLSFHELYHGKPGRVRRLLEEGLIFARQAGAPSLVAEVVYHLGLCAITEPDYSAARTLLDESLTLQRALGFRSIIAATLCHLGNVLINQGDSGAALPLFQESLEIGQELHYRWIVAAALEGLAKAEAAATRQDRAIRLFAAADALRDAIQTPIVPLWSDDYRRLQEALRAGRDPDEFEALWAQGRAMSLEQAIAYSRQTI